MNSYSVTTWRGKTSRVRRYNSLHFSWSWKQNITLICGSFGMLWWEMCMKMINDKYLLITYYLKDYIPTYGIQIHNATVWQKAVTLLSPVVDFHNAFYPFVYFFHCRRFKVICICIARTLLLKRFITYASASIAASSLLVFFAVVSVSKLFTHFHNWLHGLYLSILRAWWGMQLVICQIFYSVCGIIIILHISHRLFHQSNVWMKKLISVQFYWGLHTRIVLWIINYY